jgi:2-keto-4-pentenoate hydratase
MFPDFYGFNVDCLLCSARLHRDGAAPQDVAAAVDGFCVRRLGGSPRCNEGSNPSPSTMLCCSLVWLLQVNGKETARGDGSRVLGNPLHALAWLVNTLTVC